MKSNWWTVAGGLVLALLAAAGARAAPALGDRVESPYVEDGETSIETSGGGSIGKTLDDRSDEVVEFEHGFNSRFAASLVTEFAQAPDQHHRITLVGVEGIVSLWTIPVIDVDTGLYVEYGQGVQGDSGTGEFRALLAKREGPFEARLNLVAEHPFSNRDSTTQYSYLASADWALDRDAQVGVEAIGELGDDDLWGGRREHYLGPEAKYVINGLPYVGVKLQGAYLLALGDAPGQARAQTRWTIEIEKRF